MTEVKDKDKAGVVWINRSDFTAGICGAASETTRYSPNGPSKPGADHQERLATHGLKVARKILDSVR